MSKVTFVKVIVRLYFLGALTGSFIHIVTASHKLGGNGIEAYAVPFMIDGIAVIGMVMRSMDFSDRTNKIGFRVQCIMGAFSLAMNVYAAHNLFGVLFGVAIVALFVFAEWLSDQIEARVVVEAERAVRDAEAANAWKASCTHPTACVSAAQCTSKTASASKRRTTVARNKRTKLAEERMLARMVN